MRPRIKPLVAGEYAKTGYSTSDQTANARRELVPIIQRFVPEFFQELRDQIYPKFARYARVAQRTPEISRKGLRRGPGHWDLGWKYETWDVLSGRNRFRPLLLSWAGKFGSADETWILEGALETLAAWYEFPDWRESLDLVRFTVPEATEVLLDLEPFSFGDDGWSPQFERWSTFRTRIEAAFKKRLGEYESEVRRKIESRGGRLARSRYSVQNLEWFVLYQIRGLSSTQIENRRGAPKGDESTILKGVKTAAQLLEWKTLRSTRAAGSDGRQ